MGVWGPTPHPLFFGTGMYLYKLDEDEALLEELMASKKIISTSRGPLWFEFPRSNDILFSRYVYDSTFKRLSEEGMPTVEETYAEHEEHGLWGKAEEEALERIPEFIEETAANIAVEINRGRKKKYELWLVRLERKLAELYMNKMHLFSNTAESRASEAAHAYIAYQCFSDPRHQPLWDTYETMLQSTEDAEFINELVGFIVNESQPPDIAVIRKLARGGQWRLRWNCCKSSPEDLFSRKMADMTLTQTLLVYWSQVYDSAFESLDRPPQDVINDDIEFDRWLEEQSKKHDREAGQRYHGKGKVTKNSKIDNSPEVYNIVEGYYNNDGVFVRYTEEERWAQIEKMRNLNTDSARSVQRGVEKRLAETPHLVQPEQHLKDRHGIEATGGTIIEKGKR
jgi:hypothetical protein